MSWTEALTMQGLKEATRQEAGQTEQNAAPSSESGVRETPSLRSAGLPTPLGVAEAHGLSHVGRVRTKNDDSYVIAPLRRGVLIAVADGMGGYEGGDVASRVAVAAVAEALGQRQLGKPVKVLGLLEDVVRHADQSVRAAAAEQDLDPHMGTTLTLAILSFPNAFIAHVGDSRAYLQRGTKLECLTRDHTLAQELLSRRMLSKREAERTGLRHVLINSVGGERERDLFVDTHHLILERGDRLALCTDGLTNHVSDGEIAEHMLTTASVKRTTEALIGAALAGGGSDNATVVMARL